MNIMKNSSKKFTTLILLIIAALFFSPLAPVRSQENSNPGIRMFEEKNYYGAERFFRQALNEDPDNGQANYFLGRIANAKGDLDAATGFFEKAIEKDALNAEYHAWNGINYTQILSSVDFMKQAIYAPKSLRSLEKAVELDPSHIEARIWLAGYYANAPSFAGGSREKARDQYEKIFAIDPENVPGLFNQGIMQMSFEEFDAALESFERIIEIQPAYYPAYFQIGRLSRESGRFYSQGELSLKKYLDQAGDEFKDSKDEAWWFLGDIYFQQGMTREARKAYENAVELDPENGDYRKSLKNIL
jgi:tetratricopeptide (TPR) repeat protein